MMLTRCGMAPAWREDFWNWVDVGCIVSTWALLGGAKETINTVRMASIGFSALKFLSFLKVWSIKMATFVLLLGRVLIDVQSFMVVLIIFIAIAAALFYIAEKYVLLGKDEENGYYDDEDDDISFAEIAWTTWLMALGSYSADTYNSLLTGSIFTVAILWIVVTMMNILIAVRI